MTERDTCEIRWLSVVHIFCRMVGYGIGEMGWHNWVKYSPL
jgi:hypothetical protein